MNAVIDSPLEETWWEEAFFSNGGESLFVDEELGPLATAGDLSYIEPDHHTPRVDEEDFLDETEREVFIKVKKAVRAACNVNTPRAERRKAVEWIFVPTAEDRDRLTFALCCRALGIRDYLLQVRLQYQFYSSCILFQEPLPFLAVTVPAVLASEILYHTGEDGLALAKSIWDCPGYRADVLQRNHAGQVRNFLSTLLDLEERGYIAKHHGFWFFTGRNPDLLSPNRRRGFSWSREFA